MLYRLFKDLALQLMRAPTEPPQAPAGSHDSVEIHRAARGYLSYRLLGFWLIFGANWLLLWGMLLLGLVNRETGLVVLTLVLMPLLAVVQLCVYFAVRIDYDMRYYVVTDRSLRVREGAFIVTERTISYANVQNLRVVQGPLLRLFGIWNLRVDTAGGGTVERHHKKSVAHCVEMSGIENAHQVRDRIRGYLQLQSAGAGLGDLDDRDERRSREAAFPPELVSALTELKRSTAALRTSLTER